MSILSWLQAGPAAAQEVLRAGIAGIDSIAYTEQEKEVARQKLMTTWVDLQKALGEETTVRSVTRRLLALISMLSFTVLVFASAFAYGFDPAFAQFLLDLAESKFGWIVTIVIGFYFGPSMIARALKR